MVNKDMAFDYFKNQKIKVITLQNDQISGAVQY